MQSSSAKSRAAVLEQTEAVLAQGADASALGSDLFALAGTLDTQHALRRALTEPAVPADAKGRLLRSLVGSQLGDAAIAVAETAIGRRWSRSRDLADTLEEASVAAHVAHAESAGTLDAVEDNLFRFGRIAESNAGLRDTLSDATQPVAGKRELVANLLAGKVDDTTATLLAQAVSGRRHSLSAALSVYQRVVGERRDTLLATVWVASPLSEAHKDRMAQALSTQYSRQMHLNVIVDPAVLGGVRVAVGDEVLDSTVESRLNQAQRRLER